MKFDGVVTVDKVMLPSVTIGTLNNQDLAGFVQQALSYSSRNQTIDHDILIGNVVAENVTVGSSIGGSNPSRWLLGTGGLITGSVSFDSLIVGGIVTIGSINNVNLDYVLTKNVSKWTVKGEKHFAAIQVQDEVSVDLVNKVCNFGCYLPSFQCYRIILFLQVPFRDWVGSLLLKESVLVQHLTGFVHLIGPVNVTGHFDSDSVNGINVSDLSESIVLKDSHHQVINGKKCFSDLSNLINVRSIFIFNTGSATFTNHLQITEAEVDSLNDVLVEDLLSTSGDQEIWATLNVDMIHILGDLECPQINGFDIGDFLYTDEDNSILGRIQFINETIVEHLVVENGTINGLDIIHLLDPPSLRIDPSVVVSSDVKVLGDVNLEKELNGMDLRNLHNQFWTKSTDQKMLVNIRMPFQVYSRANITTGTFLNHSLTKDFYLTGANEVIPNYVLFFTHVNVMNDVVVEKLKPIDGVDLQALDEDVVKTEGDFQVLGTKVRLNQFVTIFMIIVVIIVIFFFKVFEQLTIHGNVIVDDTFNDLRVPEDIALLDRPQTISSMSL